MLRFGLRIIRFIFLFIVKILSTIFYPCQSSGFALKEQDWQQIKLIIFLHHTSLFEPVFVQLASIKGLWHLADKLIVPGADITFARPVVGKILHILVPGIIPISRKKDQTWQHFLALVNEEKITAILPEGRMMRRGGLDKEGNPMTIKGGVVDILRKLEHGKILFVYSGGLHHIQAPGDKNPKVFKTIKANLEVIDLIDYKRQFNDSDPEQFRTQIIADVTQKLRDNIPS